MVQDLVEAAFGVHGRVEDGQDGHVGQSGTKDIVLDKGKKAVVEGEREVDKGGRKNEHGNVRVCVDAE